MYRIITICILLITFSFSSIAQEKGNGFGKQREMFEAQKVSFITQQLQLTPGEAQNFWPLYNELNAKKRELNEQRRTLMQKIKYEEDSLTEKEIDAISDQIIDLQLQDATLQKEYHYKFKKVLPAKKVLQLYHAERQFQNMLLRRLKEHGPGHRRMGQ